MPAELGGFVSGFSKTLFGGLLQQRQEDQDAEDKATERQLTALHLLLTHPDTPEDQIPDIMDQMGDLVGYKKQVKGITDHLRAGMNRQVPSGPERETGQSIVSRMAAQPQAPTTDTLATMGGVPAQTVTTPAPLPTVPSAEMYQPTRRYGDLSQGEAQDYRKQQAFEAQQGVLTDKMLQQEGEREKRAVNIENIRAKGRSDIESSRERAAQTQLEARINAQKTLLEQKDRDAADKNRTTYEKAYLASLDREPTDEDKAAARKASGEYVVNSLNTTVAAKQASTALTQAKRESELARVTHWKNMDANSVAKNAAGGMTANQARVFRAQIITDLPELNRVAGELSKLNVNKASGFSTPETEKRIEELTKQHEDLLLKIKGARDSVIGGSTAPMTRPASDPLGLFAQP